MRLSVLRQKNIESISAAGPRYAPGLDSNAPNLSIVSLNRAFDAIGLTDQFRGSVKELRTNFEEVWRRVSPEIVRRFRRLVHNPRLLVTRLVELEVVTPRNAGVALARVQDTADHLDAVVRRLLDGALDRLRTALTKSEEDLRRAEHDQVRRFASAVRDVIDFVQHASIELLQTNAMLLLGGWGIGKTHSLCDLTERRMDLGLPTLFYLAQQLPDGVNPLEGLCRVTGLASNATALLTALDRLGRQRRTRSLVIIDAINEGDRVEWRRALPAMCRDFRRYPNVGMILSCRQPFETQIVAPRTRQQLVTVHHPGFSDIEFDAQLSFFQYYNIPAPQVPLITPEYSRPLFLQLLCKAIAHLSTGRKHRQIRSFASGQKGLTYLLEYFAKQIGAAIEHDFVLPRKTCWRILKGDSVLRGGPIVGIAPLMADHLRDYITWDECLNVIEPFVNGPRRRQRARRLARRMLADGLLAEDLRWDGNSYREVIRFPYQRFGDHIIARYLLRPLDTISLTAIRRSFYRTKPLGRVFELAEGKGSFLKPGLASAIMLEFPERVKGRVPPGEIELIFYLPKSRRLLAPFKEAFLEGLPWRSADHFTSVTGGLVTSLLERYDEYTRNDTFEVLVGLAARPGHPFSAERLSRYLATLAMADRDLSWTEYIRHANEVSVVFKLIEWVERNATVGLHADTVDAIIRLLSLILTTTHRPLRDRATRALFLIGLKQPGPLFTIALSYLAFGDPYVSERFLAASYGVASSLWADPGVAAMRTALIPFVRELVTSMFVPGAPHATRHVLTRDYALNLIRLARRLDPNAIPRRNLMYLRSPFTHLPAQLPPPDALTQTQRIETEPALHMDFDNYTLGRLVPQRRNYDSQNQEYQFVRNQLLARMSELGYKYSRFKGLDELIQRSNWWPRSSNGNKTDRYGKKYSWIAYFELCGLRQDHGQLRDSDRPPFQRMSGCDIDPSFPEPVGIWRVPLPDVFRGAPIGAAEWLRTGPIPRYDHLLQRTSVDGLRGAWVLLNGFIVQQAQDDAREVFTFLRGLLISERRVDRLRGVLERRPYPGNDAIPRPYGDVYTYAGEIPWSPNFGSYLRTKRGKAKRNIQSAFEQWREGQHRWGIPVEVPVHEFEWESYHSTMNEAGNPEVPAPALCEFLGLENRPRTFEFYDATGRQATICRRIEERGMGRLLYMRRSTLRRYLRATQQTLVWILWGERNFAGGSGMHDRPDVRAVFPEYRHIHKRFITSGL